MELNLDSRAITLTCPGCSKEFNETVGRLKDNPALPCPGCGSSIDIDANQLLAAIQSAEKFLDDL